ncbi:hypothetical protein WMF30_54885 [Sorangium sp. So ce134]
MRKTVDEILAEFTSCYGPQEVWVLSLPDAEIVARLRAMDDQACTILADYLEPLFAREHADPGSIKRELEEYASRRPGSWENWPDRSDRTASGADAWVAYHLASCRAMARRLILDWEKQAPYFQNPGPSSTPCGPE